MKCCELRRRLQPLDSPQCGYWYFSLVLVKYKWTVAQSLDFGHFNAVEAVHIVDDWVQILCLFYRGSLIIDFFSL